MGKEMLPFKKGAFVMAIQAQVLEVTHSFKKTKNSDNFLLFMHSFIN